MKKSTWTNIILIAVLIIGLSLLLYPSFSNWWNARVQTRAIASYSEQLVALDENEYDQLWTDARNYNETLLTKSNVYALSEEQQKAYDQLLNFTGSGIMGYIEIPSLGVELPLYHGTEENVLQVAIGHVEWSSLPTGGEDTHCVVSGHRGLPSARLFTDLDQLAVGDYFVMHILDEMLTYEVDQIRIVEPRETEDLLIQKGKDLCTLVTCTPYGVNSHRLLVRGHRVDNLEEAQDVRVTADAMIVEKMIVVPFVLVPILLILLVLLLTITGRKNRRNRRKVK